MRDPVLPLALLMLALLPASPGCSGLPGGLRAAGVSRDPAAGPAVMASARNVPVLHDVDVVVVGGTSGAVAAATAAAEGGARVFLAAPRSYLGDDICGTYRLWLEPDEQPDSPLAQAVFSVPPSVKRLRNTLPFVYEADVESASPHKDANPPAVLGDKKWQSASSQSVQYNGDPNIVVDLGAEKFVDRVHLMVYQRDRDFEVKSVTVSVSANKRRWLEAATVENPHLGHGSYENEAIPLSVDVGRKTRYVRFAVRKTSAASRVLIGEILVEKKDDGGIATVYRSPPTPMQVKRVLDDALLEAGVPFLYGCYPTAVLRDRDGHPAGIVMANRSGHQAIKAKVVIDATPRAVVARMAGAQFDVYPAGERTFKRIVVGGESRPGDGVKVRELRPPVVVGSGRTYPAFEYTIRIPMADGSSAAFARAEQIARDKTWHRDQVDAAENLFQVPPDRMKGKGFQCCQWPGADKAEMDAFRPQRIERLYVLGGCADVSREAAATMLRPLELMRLGDRLGRTAAEEAASVSPPQGVKRYGRVVKAVTAGDVREDDAWMRTDEGIVRVPVEAHPVPVLGEYEVVVVGGGTAGAPAGIAAARRGAKTLVVEYLHGLGGVGTLGLISKYYHGYRRGFTAEIDRGLAELGGEAEGHSGKGQAWNNNLKIEWYRSELRSADADIWYGALGCGAFVHGNQVKGVVVATDQGYGVVLADAVIDSTGSASIAAAAGADCIYTAGEHIAVQGTGLPYNEPGKRYTNTDYTFVDDIDVTDAWRAFVVGRKKFQGRYDLGQLIDTRERRQIVGDFFLPPMDAYLSRTFPDTVVLANSNFDTHGFTIHPMFMLKPPDRKDVPCYIPYRCLLPAGLEGMLVTGLGVSAHRDVMPVIRMQPDVQNQGYAVGVAAAMAIRRGIGLRDVNIRKLQEHLVDKGNLPAEVLRHEDSFPLPPARIEEAVQAPLESFENLAILFAQPNDSLPLIREAYTKAESQEDRLMYAHILGIMGDSAGADILAGAVEASEWDKGWKYTGMGQFGRSISEVDSLIIALGRTERDIALAPILAKVEHLGPEHAMSHHRAVALALETLGDPRAARPLAELLKKPGMGGHAYTHIEEMTADIPASAVDTSTREHSLRELILARALYRCGDHEGLGERTLREYARDFRGHYARHALAVLNETKSDN